MFVESRPVIAHRIEYVEQEDYQQMLVCFLCFGIYAGVGIQLTDKTILRSATTFLQRSYRDYQRIIFLSSAGNSGSDICKNGL